MSITIVHVKNDHRDVAQFIVDNLVERSDEKIKANNLEKVLTDDNTYLLAAVLNETVIGYALAYRFPSLYGPKYLGYLYDIEVLETHRRKGAGRFLMETMLKRLKADGVEEVWLGTGTDNVEAQAMYISTGAVKSEETFNDFTYTL